jgi:Thioesterase-like superfamily
VTEPLFVSDGDRYQPSPHTVGPWDERAQHGGAPAALMAREIERLATDTPMAVARMTVEILRPVPLAPLSVSARVERPGKRVQLVSAGLRSDGTELCRVSAWRVRKLEPAALESSPADTNDVIPPSSAATPHTPESERPAFHRTGVELRFVRGSFYAMGPSTVWIRLLRPVVDDEAPSPLMRTMAASDFGNGVSAVLDFRSNVFINIDLSVHLARHPVGEWICLDARTLVDASGVGLAESALHDETGRIGRSLQTLLVEPATQKAGSPHAFAP